ncbi:uncharacterized protein LOC100678358 [Nasonia vitripennis]|uniref:Uncharacterized protein n=1 Tax=Nasonia vitripennis TaxID=7425 RepID=A0A7M7T6T4_NASVI|nr:uncharacterized protein LOC100678358 [Nasonia vitripennis]XP_031778499.1 uncharacterized protein LOC100678358 [Nasonia vitripennis]
MGKTKRQVSQVKRAGCRPRRQRIIRPLNLPPEIWQKYLSTKSHKENIQQTNTYTTEMNLPASTASENKLVMKDVKATSSKTSVGATCCNSAGNEPNILKQLSVKIDNSYAVQFNCLFLNENLCKALEIHKSIYDKVMNAKQAFIKFSVQTVIHNKEKGLSDHVILAESELNVSLNLLEKQELLLSNLQKTFREITAPLSVLTCYNIEQDNMLRLSACLSKKENEIDDLKQRNGSLEIKIRNNEQKLLKTKQTYQNIIKTKDKLLSDAKRKCCLMMKRIRLMKESNRRKNNNNMESLGIQAKIKNLVAESIKLTESLKKNILENHTHSCTTCNNELAVKNKNEIIFNLNNQLKDLHKQNKRKDNVIHSLLISSRHLNRQIVAIKESSKLKEKQCKFETAKLTSCIDNLRRKQDRWLTDRFFQKRHSIMLFEKIKQMEIQENKKALFCFNKIEKNSNDAVIPKT